MPFDEGTRRGSFGKTNPKTVIPAENRPEGWGRQLAGEDVPAVEHQSTGGSGISYGTMAGLTALTATLICAPLVFVAFGGGKYHRGSEGCVDEKGVVVDDWNCRSTSRSGHFYRPHYGGNYRIGSTPVGGTYTAPEAGSSVLGIFGSVGHSFGAGG